MTQMIVTTEQRPGKEAHRALKTAMLSSFDEDLRRRLQEQAEWDAKLAAIKAATGLSDVAAVVGLAELDVGVDTLVALSLAPTVIVAWADGSLHENERAAVLSAAIEIGIVKQGASYELLESWLREPPEGLFRLWERYVDAIVFTMDDEARRELASKWVGCARRVAESAGGILGLINTVSRSEELALQRLRAVLS